MLHKHRDALNRIENDIDKIERKSKIDWSQVCDKCLSQIMDRKTLADPFSTCTHREARRSLITDYKFCPACSDAIGVTRASQINPSPEAQ